MKKFLVTLEVEGNDTVNYLGVDKPVGLDIDHMWAYLETAQGNLIDDEFVASCKINDVKEIK